MKGYKKLVLLLMSFTLLTACNNDRADEEINTNKVIQKNSESSGKSSQNTASIENKVSNDNKTSGDSTVSADNKVKSNISNDDKPVTTPNPPQQAPIKGITVNKIDFQVVGLQELKPSLKSYFESKKEFKGYSIYKDEDGYEYIAIFSGRKKTGGYGIKVLHVEDIEGKTVVTVQETSPKPSTYVTQALTYPFTVIRIKNIIGPIMVKDAVGKEFKPISSEGAER